MGFCLVWGFGGAFISLALSRVMAKWMMGVKVIDPNTHDSRLQDLVQLIHRLARQSGLTTMPQVGIYESPELNAFATGPTRSRALVAISTGLLEQMSHEQLEGVLGHEITHITNGDMVTMTLLQGVINAFVMFLARVLAFAVSQAMRDRDSERSGGGGWFMQYMLTMVFEMVFALFGAMVVAAFSRWREFRADAGSARLAGREPMIAALKKLQSFYANPRVMEQMAAVTADQPATVKTLKIAGRPTGFLGLLASHPPLEDRIARLETMTSTR
jgi:heat shock protein HtpX